MLSIFLKFQKNAPSVSLGIRQKLYHAWSYIVSCFVFKEWTAIIIIDRGQRKRQAPRFSRDDVTVVSTNCATGMWSIKDEKQLIPKERRPLRVTKLYCVKYYVNKHTIIVWMKNIWFHYDECKRFSRDTSWRTQYATPVFKV